MPRQRTPWFRFHSEAVHSRKAMALKPQVFRWWVLALCEANIGKPRGRLPSLDDLAYDLRMSKAQVREMLAALKDAGLVDLRGDWYWAHDWNEWQRKRDVAPSLRDEGEDEDDDDPPPVNHARRDLNASENHDAVTQVNHAEEEVEKEKEEEVEKERENARAPGPDEIGFVGEYVRHYEQREGKIAPFSHLADARSLERDFGGPDCIAIATDHEWQYHPNWYRKKLENRDAPVQRHTPGRNAVSGESKIAAFARREGLG